MDGKSVCEIARIPFVCLFAGFRAVNRVSVGVLALLALLLGERHGKKEVAVEKDLGETRPAPLLRGRRLPRSLPNGLMGCSPAGPRHAAPGRIRVGGHSRR